jgi:NAD(P)-dependent dehydrogenase (short-subunit alcohol dehydrogenase family)
MSLKGKYALITGSSRGIGRGIALKLAEQGVKVAINYCRNEVAANDVLGKVRRLGSDGFIVQGDVCTSEDIALMFRRARQEFGALDIFVANARPEVPTFYQPPMEITLESWQTAAVVSVRFNGVGRRSTHVLEEVYNRAALEIRRGTVTTLAAVRQSLRQIYIPDDEFEADFSVLRLRNRSTSGKRLRYLLAKIEKQLSGTDISDEAMTATVEHILPENPGEVGLEYFTAEAHERSYERVGNYSLLERALNGQLAGNAPFAQKQLVYAQS